MEDVVPELYEKIKREFEKRTEEDPGIRKFTDRIRDGSAKLQEASLFAACIGNHLSDILMEVLTADTMPDGRMYYNIADRLIRPMLEKNYERVNIMAVQVQEQIDRQMGIHIRPVKGVFPEERIRKIIGAVSENGLAFEEIKKRMDEPIRNTSQSFFDDFVKENVKFRYKAGMAPVIIREPVGNACEWCRALAGVYRYPDVPKDIYRRHDRCRCTVTYRVGKLKKDVWTKRITEEDPDVMEERKTFGAGLTRRTAQEAGSLENEVRKKIRTEKWQRSDARPLHNP